MKALSDKVKLGNLELKNRLIRSATLEMGGGENGRITPLLGQVYRELAQGGCGLIITGMMGVCPNAGAHAGMPKIYEDSFPEQFGAIAEDVHRQGGKIVVQLSHCGARAKDLDGVGHPLAPSDITLGDAAAKAMTVQQIEEVVQAFGTAARRCQEAGADGVQLHAAHGYLLSQFLSPLFNKRTDAYGVPIENRARIVLDAYEEIRRQVGAEYPVLIKMNFNDLAEGGIAEEEVLWYCKALDRRGIDAIEVSAGIALDKFSGPIRARSREEGFNADYALRLAEQVDCGIISVGGYRTPEVMNEVLNRGYVSAFALCRALIREPDLPKRWLEGNPQPATCTSCGKCFFSPQLGCFLDQAG